MKIEHFNYEQISAHLSYDPKSGNLIWWNPTSSRIPQGSVAGSLNNQGYHRVSFKGKVLASHRVAWLLHYKKWPINQIDHINRNRQDNRISNLRDVTAAENIANSDRSGRLGERRRTAKGYTWNKRAGKWQVQAHDPRLGRAVYVGLFETVLGARKAYEPKLAEFDL